MLTGFHNAVSHNDVLDDFMVNYRNRAWSAKAWHRYKHEFCDKRHLADFCAGFRQGYQDVATGADGCTPAMAPPEYWGWRYQSPEGQAKVNAWFEGYPLGAKAAEEDGIGGWGHIRTMVPAPEPMPPIAVPIEELPPGGAPTPLEPMAEGSSVLPGNALGAAGMINMDRVTKVPAASVPTVASGR